MSIYEQAIKKWGIDSQIDMAIEECAELIVELQHARRKRSSVTKICGEIADVEIMCSQMRVIFDSTKVDNIKALKLERLKELIKGE